MSAKKLKDLNSNSLKEVNEVFESPDIILGKFYWLFFC